MKRLFITLLLIIFSIPSFGEKYIITKTWLWGLTDNDVKRAHTTSSSILHDTKKNCEKDLLYIATGSIVKKTDSKGELYLQNFEKNDLLDLVSIFTCTKLYGPNFE